jgi:dTDP-4-dehydrorhamnose reductase
MERIVILGDGLLGAELHRQTGWDVISRKKDNFDITDPSNFDTFINWYNDPQSGKIAGTPKYNTIINCIAFTETYSEDKQKHWDVNYKAVANLVDFCNHWGIKLVHISTTYVYANSKREATEEDVPVHQATHYAHTKLLADGYVELRSKNYLLIRTTHKPRPFPFSTAWLNHEGNFDYVDIIGSLVVEAIKKEATGVLNLGTELKSMYQLAKQTSPNVEPTIVHDKLIPTDFSMSLTKMKNLLS